MLLDIAANNRDQFFIVGDEVRTRGQGIGVESKSCGGYELLAQVLHAAQPSAPAAGLCELQLALQSTASKPARRSSLMSLDGIPAHLTADEVRGSTAPVSGASATGLGATTAPPWSSQSRSVRKQSRACAGH